MSSIIKTPHANEIPFDNSTNGFTADRTQPAIEELKNQVVTSASPGFSFGRSGNISKGAYLQNDSVPSNIVGRYVYISSAYVTKVFVGNELSGTFKYEVLYHNINEVGLTLLGSVTVTATYGGAFTVSWAVPTGTYLCIRVASDSTDAPKNVVCGLELRGTNV